MRGRMQRGTNATFTWRTSQRMRPRLTSDDILTRQRILMTFLTGGEVHLRANPSSETLSMATLGPPHEAKLEEKFKKNTNF